MLVHAMSGAITLRAPLVQPARHLTSGGTCATLHPALKGWAEGLVTLPEWLDSGGPLDASDHLPAGGAWAHHWPGGCLLGASVRRPGATA